MSRSSLNLERLAIHPRCRQKVGQRIKILEHFPANSIAFYEATPQKLLSQSRFIHADLNALFLELFNADVYAHLRRAQGLISACTKEIKRSGHTLANAHIATPWNDRLRWDRFVADTDRYQPLCQGGSDHLPGRAGVLFLSRRSDERSLARPLTPGSRDCYSQTIRGISNGWSG
jgi:hypothetical protein